MTILNLFFPTPADNTYRGRKIALWLFYPITLFTIARSLVHILAPDGGAQSIATFPLDSYTYSGAAAVVHLFALWGLSQLLLGLIYLVILWRYRSLIPLMYLLLAIEYSARLLLGGFKPVELSGTAPGAIGNIFLIPLALLMLFLSLSSRKESA
jgi:hypothetical protein